MAARKKSTAKKKAAPKKKAAAKKKKAAPRKKATPRKRKAAPKKKKAAPKAKAPVETAPAETAPAETTPGEAAAVDAAPAEAVAQPPLEEVAPDKEAAEDTSIVEAVLAKLGQEVVKEGAAVAAVTAEEEAEAVPAPRPLPKMPARRKDGKISVAFSPDADDVFMFFGLLTGKVDTEDREYELVRDEIQTLNERAQKGVYDVTAISFGAWPYVMDRYLLLSCGASFGDGRGPILVARSPIRTNEVNGLKVAVPGRHTTAALALRVWLPHAKMELIEYPFDEVIAAVRMGSARAGVLIHERQLTWRDENLVHVVDFGQWWTEKTEGLPLPLGANAIRRDIPEEERAKIALDIKRSIAYGLGHREEALDYSMQYAKGLERKIVDRYVSMYVNELALDYAERGRQAVRQFLAEAERLGFVPEGSEPEFA